MLIEDPRCARPREPCEEQGPHPAEASGRRTSQRRLASGAVRGATDSAGPVGQRRVPCDRGHCTGTAGGAPLTARGAGVHSRPGAPLGP